jgi:L-seryl-tRNA(Ser) seleniumtransferase
MKAMGPDWSVEVLEVAGRAGGGSMPLREAPGWAVALGRPGAGADAVEAALRAGDPPVIGRIAGDRVLLDLRAVATEEEPAVLARLGHVAAAFPGPAGAAGS